jgi:hypothetical protein
MVAHLPVPACVYVTQKAYLLTGTLRENFEGYPGDEIEQALKTVDLTTRRRRKEQREGEGERRVGSERASSRVHASDLATRAAARSTVLQFTEREC